MTNKEAAHIVDVAFGVPQAVRRIGEDKTYHEDEIREAKDMAILALEQEPKTGHWIDTNSDRFVSHKVYKCSECGTTEIEYPENIYRHFRYCPNCGAKMESEG